MLHDDTHIYGYVDPVAINFDSAPRRKKSQSVRTATAAEAPLSARRWRVRRAMRMFLSCSKTVYWMTGLMTSMRAGPMPRQRALEGALVGVVKLVGCQEG